MTNSNLPEWMPPVSRHRAANAGYRSVRQLELAAKLPNGKLKYLYSADTRAIVQLVAYLKALGYSCNGPEFDVINEICSQNMVEKFGIGAKLSPSSETQNVYVLCNAQIRSTYIGCAA